MTEFGGRDFGEKEDYPKVSRVRIALYSTFAIVVVGAILGIPFAVGAFDSKTRIVTKVVKTPDTYYLNKGHGISHSVSVDGLTGGDFNVVKIPVNGKSLLCVEDYNAVGVSLNCDWADWSKHK